MADETRLFSGADEIEIYPECKVFNTFGEIDVLVNIDPNNSSQFAVTMDSTRWPGQESNYVAPKYPPVV